MKEDGITVDRFHLMCPDLERAAKNREMVAKGKYIEYWLALERLARTPRSQPLPKWAFGELPQVGKRSTDPHYLDLEVGD